MLSKRTKRGVVIPTLDLQDKIIIGKKHVGKTVEIVCDEDAQYVDFLVDSGQIHLERQAKIYLAARRKNTVGHQGMVDTGPRDQDEFLNLPSQRFYNSGGR